MSIRLRTVHGIRVALCAVESDPRSGDLYLDDGDHFALAAKFARDWQGQTVDWRYPREWEAMDTQKRRDAQEELQRNLAALDQSAQARVWLMVVPHWARRFVRAEAPCWKGEIQIGPIVVGWQARGEIGA